MIGIKTENNVFILFGKTIHSTIEQLLKKDQEEKINNGEKEEFDSKNFFLTLFKDSLETLSKEQKQKTINNQELIQDMKIQGQELISIFLPEFKKHFGNFKLVRNRNRNKT